MVFAISECEIENNGVAQKCLKVIVPDEETKGVYIFNIPVVLVDSIVRALASYVGIRCEQQNDCDHRGGAGDVTTPRDTAPASGVSLGSQDLGGQMDEKDAVDLGRLAEVLRRMYYLGPYADLAYEDDPEVVSREIDRRRCCREQGVQC